MPESRNWADLPRELLQLICKKLPADRIYLNSFCAVCKNWRSFVSPLSDSRWPQLPWLIERHGEYHYGSLDPNLRFYSLAGGDTGTISVPEAYCGLKYYGPGHGYLLVSSAENYNRCLFNPLTSKAVSLTFLDGSFWIAVPACSGSDPLHNWHVMSSHKIYETKWNAFIYHSDQNNRTLVKIDFHFASCSTCCVMGRFYATEAGCSMGVFHANSGEKLFEVPALQGEVCEDSQFYRTYLVESCGEILRVSLNFDYDIVEQVEVPMFGIYKLLSGGEQHSWVKIYDIGDQILFLDLMNGFSMEAPAGFEGNCIYFLLNEEGGSKPCRYDIESGAVEMVPCPFNKCTWFIPKFG